MSSPDKNAVVLTLSEFERIKVSLNSFVPFSPAFYFRDFFPPLLALTQLTRISLFFFPEGWQTCDFGTREETPNTRSNASQCARGQAKIN
jgi:hypothetical protein